MFVYTLVYKGLNQKILCNFQTIMNMNVNLSWHVNYVLINQNLVELKR